MNWKEYGAIGVVGLVILLTNTLFQNSPGYMDSEYYYSGGVRLAQGHGFSELILWNYLDNPVGLPHPSHGYWMPLVSIVAAIGIAVFRETGFWSARAPFLIIAAGIAPLTAALSWKLSRRRCLAWMSGILAIFSGFYLAYLTTTDSFALYMICGALFFLLIPSTSTDTFPSHRWELAPVLLGILAGLMHLTRADGVIWLIMALGVSFYSTNVKSRRFRIGIGTIESVVFCILGYLIVMGPWMYRNLAAYNTLLAPGSAKALWIHEYNELFTYPASQLTFSRWWQTGQLGILSPRWQSFSQNLQTTVAVQGEIFLVPFILLGLWRLRKEGSVRSGIFAWSLTFFIMTIIFPFQGARGGFFHSGAALQPVFWAVAPVGLEKTINWAAEHRRWNLTQAKFVFSISLVILAICFSGLLFFTRVVGIWSQPVWNDGDRKAVQIEQRLLDLGAQPAEVVMVNNAPGYFASNYRPSVSIPFGPISTVLEVAQRYQVCYLILDFNQIVGFDPQNALSDQLIGLIPLSDQDGTQIYQFSSCNRQGN